MLNVFSSLLRRLLAHQARTLLLGPMSAKLGVLLLAAVIVVVIGDALGPVLAGVGSGLLVVLSLVAIVSVLLRGR